MINILVGIHCLDMLTWLFFSLMWNHGSIWLVSICRKISLRIQSHFWEEFDLAPCFLRSYSRQLNQSLLPHQLPMPWQKEFDLTSYLLKFLCFLCWQRFRWTRGQHWKEQFISEIKMGLITMVPVAKPTRVLPLISSSSLSFAALLWSKAY